MSRSGRAILVAIFGWIVYSSYMMKGNRSLTMTILLPLASRIDDYCCDESVNILERNYSYLSFLKLRLILKVQNVVQKLFPELRLKYENNETEA
jgi:hypothetical protein